MLNYISLGRKVRFCRTKRGMTQEELAERVGCSPPYVSYIECGYKCMSLSVFVEIANALGVDADTLLVDSLNNTQRFSVSMITNLLADCSEYEMHVLCDVLNASKLALRANRSRLHF